MTTTPGRRIPKPDGLAFEPGDYWQDDDGTWYCFTPNLLLAWLKNHHVEEHEDGTVSVLPGSWGSNSILCSNGTGNKTWHGYIRRGVFEEC